jgi:hypothetical protein
MGVGFLRSAVTVAVEPADNEKPYHCLRIGEK